MLMLWAFKLSFDIDVWASVGSATVLAIIPKNEAIAS
jgi:hypothetical protein